LHYHWDLNWPWLALGNALAPLHQIVQFYEFTGVTGGSFWILICNILIFNILNKILEKENIKKTLLAFSIIFIVPLSYSLVRYFTFVEKGKDIEILVVQPNTDPYNQYDIDSDVLMEKVFNLINQKITNNTALIVAPESMILDYAWEENIEFYPSIRKIQEYLQDFPNTEFLSGISTMQVVDKESYASRYIQSINRHYVIHNTALLMSKDCCNEMYFKSRLTPGVEIVPFSNIFPFIKNFAVDLGGAIGSLAVDTCAKVFHSEYSHPPFSANICYESVFPDYVRKFVKNGAEYICIITNDGWWGDTEGYKQHQRYAKLRAIETRRAIARSANTGTSCFVNQRGDVFQKTNYWEEAVISQNIKANKGKTLFVLTGDYLGMISSVLAILFIFAFIFIAGFKKKRNFEK
jgi:apolipoprotein N-acyltransferase